LSCRSKPKKQPKKHAVSAVNSAASTAIGRHEEETEENLGVAVLTEGAVATTAAVVGVLSEATMACTAVVVGAAGAETVSVRLQGVVVPASVAIVVEAPGPLSTTSTFPATAAGEAMTDGLTTAAVVPGLGHLLILAHVPAPARVDPAPHIPALGLGLNLVPGRFLVVPKMPKPVTEVTSGHDRRLARSVVGAETAVVPGGGRRRQVAPLPQNAAGTRHPEAGRVTEATA
jgi:hypothetical protein